MIKKIPDPFKVCLDRFEQFMKLTVEDDYAKKVAKQVKRLFTLGIMDFSTFNNPVTFYTALKKYCSSFPSTAEIMPQKDRVTSNVWEALPLKSSTVYNYIIAAIHFDKFLGNDTPKHILLFSQQISKRSRNQNESDILVMFFHFNVTMNILNEITRNLAVLFSEIAGTCLKCWKYLEKPLDTELKRSVTQNLLETIPEEHRINQITKYKISNAFGHYSNNRIATWIELSLRLYVMPLPVKVLRNLKYYQPMTIEAIEKLYQKHAPVKPTAFLFVNKDTNQLFLSYVRPDDKNLSERLVHVALPNWLGGIFIVYLHCYRKNKGQYGELVFEVVEITTKVNELTNLLGLPGEWFGFKPARGYHYQSRILWILRQTYTVMQQRKIGLLHPETVDVMSRFGVVADIGTATSQSNKYYHGVDQLRELVASIQYFKKALFLDETIPTTQLTCLSVNSQGKELADLVFSNQLLDKLSKLVKLFQPLKSKRVRNQNWQDPSYAY